MTKMDEREMNREIRWLLNCSLVSYTVLSEGSFSAGVPSSSSEELSSFSLCSLAAILPSAYFGVVLSKSVKRSPYAKLEGLRCLLYARTLAVCEYPVCISRVERQFRGKCGLYCQSK